MSHAALSTMCTPSKVRLSLHSPRLVASLGQASCTCCQQSGINFLSQKTVLLGGNESYNVRYAASVLDRAPFNGGSLLGSENPRSLIRSAITHGVCAQVRQARASQCALHNSSTAARAGYSLEKQVTTPASRHLPGHIWLQEGSIVREVCQRLLVVVHLLTLVVHLLTRPAPNLSWCKNEPC